MQGVLSYDAEHPIFLPKHKNVETISRHCPFKQYQHNMFSTKLIPGTYHANPIYYGYI